MQSTWCMRRPDPAAVAELARAASLPEVAAALLVSRGHTEHAATERHLRASPLHLHDPFLLPGMEAATERLVRALRDGETLLVHGDYDVDGVTGTALLVRLFRHFGGRVVWHIPNRLTDGYSFGDHSIERAVEVGAGVVISVDNGTSAHEVIAQLQERSIDVVVTDHHEPSAGELPPAVAIVNPKLHESTYPWRELCGGAVAFKLAWGLAKKMNGGRKATGALKAFLEEATAYVAIATVCDVVPLLDENRVFARFGLKALRTAESPGLAALLAITGIEGPPSAEDVAFQIGPRINASGRLGSAETAVALLLADDKDEARSLARQLDDLNTERRAIEAEVLAEAREEARGLIDRDDPPMLVLAGQRWHQGVVGIVAARIVEEFGRPALVIGLDGETGRGSARTVEGFHVLEALAGGAEHFLRFGGHAQAAGVEIEAAAVERARVAVCERAAGLLADRRPTVDELWIDYDLPFEHMTKETMDHIDRLEPFGEKNEKPVLVSRDLRLAREPRTVGSDGSHLMLQLRRGPHALKGMAFGKGHRAGELSMGAPLDVVYTPRWNRFRGQCNLELVLHDFHVGG